MKHSNQVFLFLYIIEEETGIFYMIEEKIFINMIKLYKKCIKTLEQHKQILC